MLDRQALHLKALVWIDFVYISFASGRPLKHPDELLALFESVVCPEDYHPNGFKRRVEAARHTRMQAL